MATKKIKLLFVSQHVVHNSTYQAGHKSFEYYLSKFCNDEAFEVGYLLDHNNDESFFKMKHQFDRARDFSISPPLHIRLLKYPFYNHFVKNFLSIINPSWIYFSPFRWLLYKKALINLKKQGWVPDIIAFEWTEVIFLSPLCRKLFPNARLTATEHDVTFNKLYRQYRDNLYFKLFLLARFKKLELNILKSIDLVLVLSTNDYALLKNNGVDIHNILLVSPYYNRTNRPQKNLKSDIVFYGAMNRVENQDAVTWFIENVFIPFQLFKFVSLTVVGSGVPSNFINKYRQVENLIITGFVEHPEDYFESALCMVVPLTYGGGIKIKVLEAMSASVTILSNDIGIEGINAVPNKSYIHCTEPIDYYQAIMKLNDNKDLACSIGEAGRLMMQSNYNYEKSYQAYRDKLISLHKPMKEAHG